MKHIVERDGQREMWIRYTIEGKIPEKSFVLTRDENGEVKQDPDQLAWESNIRKQFGDQCGWLQEDPLTDDFTDAAYTPLECQITIHTPDKSIIVKQAKSILDALEGVAYVNDCCVVQLMVERIVDEDEYADITLHPAHYDLRIPDLMAQIISTEEKFRPVTDTAYDIKGYSLDKDKKDKDKHFRQYIRKLCKEADVEMIEGDIHLIALIGTQDIPVRMLLQDKFDCMFSDRWPTAGPDADNIGYCLMRALDGVAYDNIHNLMRFNIIKQFRGTHGEVYDRVWVGPAL